jgi:hypothetical protein
LKDNILPEDHASAECIVQLAKRYAGDRRGSIPPWRQWHPHAVHHPG